MERWLPVVGYEDLYEVSNRGQVRRLDLIAQEARRTYLRKGAVLSQSSCSGGRYLKVSLSAHGKRRTCTVHGLVAEAFIGPRPVGMEICHNNGDSRDNCASNLRYDTPSANHWDTVQHGNHHQVNKTQCKQGHPFDDANTRHSRGQRVCRACERAAQARYRARIRTAA